MHLNPIILFVYNRPLHTKQTIESLLNNKISKNSVLYVFSDAGKNESDSKKVEEVRSYLRELKGFNSVIIEESKTNKGLAQSVISGVTKVLDEFKSAIVLEDDLVFSSNFLEYMNDALNFYSNDEKIFSISGYSFPIILPQDHNKDIFLSKRASSWGWGTWKNRWDKVDWNVSSFESFKKDKGLQEKFNSAGDDLSIMLTKQMRGEISSWAVRWSFHHFINNGFCLYPNKSKVKNTGMDSSGVHSKKSNKFDVELSSDNINLIADIKFDERVEREMKEFFRQSLVRKLVNKIRYKL